MVWSQWNPIFRHSHTIYWLRAIIFTGSGPASAALHTFTAFLIPVCNAPRLVFMGRHEWRSQPIQQAPPSSAKGTVPRPCGRVRSKRTTCAWIVRARQFTAQGRTKRRASPVPFTHAPNNDRQPSMPKAAPREKTRRAKPSQPNQHPDSQHCKGPAQGSRASWAGRRCSVAVPRQRSTATRCGPW